MKRVRPAEMCVFDEDQTLKDVEKTEKEIIPQHNDDPIDLDPVPPKHFDAQLGASKTNIWHSIFRDRGAKKLHISQEQYIEKVLRRFNMDKAKVVSSPLTPNFKLTDKDCPSSKKNIEKMDRVSYASAVGSLMYAMVLRFGLEIKDIMKSLFWIFDDFAGGLLSREDFGATFLLVSGFLSGTSARNGFIIVRRRAARGRCGSVSLLRDSFKDTEIVIHSGFVQAIKRYEATRWLRKSVGVVAAKDLPAEPSEQNFRQVLRSGKILCKVLNKIERGVTPIVEEAPCDSVIIPDGAPLSSCPYFENIINFLSAIEERRLPTFEAGL
ncbi:retrovirus-related pol polyprotein from transposon TNT 1-94 [Tanacetum coccineum]